VAVPAGIETGILLSVNLVEALQAPILLGDGANGTLLAEYGFEKQPYDLANLLAPDLVVRAHAAYFDAGADFVETNTFSANRFKLADRNIDIRALNEQGARLARQAAGEGRIVLGAIGPAGKPMEPIGSITREDVRDSIAQQAEALAEGGVDGFMLETFIDLNELAASVEGVRQVSDLPIVVSKAYIEDGEMLAEGLPLRCTKTMSEMGVVAVGANCIVGPQRMLDLVRMIGEGCDLPILAMPTPGFPQLVKGQVAYDTSPEYFAKATLRLAEEGARIVGGCCGTTPEHIRELRRQVGKGVKRRARKRSLTVEKDLAPLPETAPTELMMKLERKFLYAVELDVPRGVNLDRLFQAARLLKIEGVDVINISDGARARLRMNPVAVCEQIQRHVGIETTMHFSCRDRNLLAVQADLLGCHAMGVRNILAVTGDPANIGDYPSATSVFDVDAIGLARILARLNEGIDLAGYSVGVQCGFTICVAYNPLAMDPEFEHERLQRKADAGAHVVYTQPVFEKEAAERAVEACAKLGLPCLVGVLPLRSQRHCEFMHNEVPGIHIPDWLRNQMAGAQSDEDALRIGIEQAQELARHIRTVAQGLYLMPPANSAEAAAQIVAGAR
jgi:methionine synthase / methylenetetrahydrofolate reductase(NADPH)